MSAAERETGAHRHEMIAEQTRRWPKRWHLVCIMDNCRLRIGPFRVYGDLLFAQRALRSSSAYARVVAAMSTDPRLLAAVGKAVSRG